MPENFERPGQTNNRPDQQQALQQVLIADVLRQQFKGRDDNDASLGTLIKEFGHSAIYSGVQAPIKGLTQLVDLSLAERLTIVPPPAEATFLSARWHAQQAGAAAGVVVPFMATRGAMKQSGLSLATRVQNYHLQGGQFIAKSNKLMIADGAATGFACDFLTHPVTPSEGNFWLARTGHGITGAVTMGSLTAVNLKLSRVGGDYAAQLTGLKKVGRDIAIGGLSGVPAGAINADTHSLLSKGKLATNEERLKSAYTMGFAGATLSGMHKLEGQDTTIVQRTVGRIQDGTVKKVGDFGSSHNENPTHIAEPTAVENFLLGTEFTKVELNIGGEKTPYYAAKPFYDLPATHSEKYGFYILGEGLHAPILIRDREIMVQPDSHAVQPQLSGSARATAVTEGVTKLGRANHPSLPASNGIAVGRIREGTIKIATESGDSSSQAPPKVLQLPEHAAATFDFGAHFGRLQLNISGEPVDYYRSKVSSDTLKIEPNEFYRLSQNEFGGGKLIRDRDVFLVPRTAMDGMPTMPLCSKETGFRFGGAWGKAQGPDYIFDSSRIECNSESGCSSRFEPKTESFEPYVEKFEPPREGYDADYAKQSDSHAGDFGFLFREPLYPENSRGSSVVGADANGRNVMYRPGWGKDFEKLSISLDRQQLNDLGSDRSRFKKVDVVIDGRKRTYYQDVSGIYRLSQQQGKDARLEREYQVFIEPDSGIFGDLLDPDGLYLNRWRPPVDPRVPATGTVVGKADGVTIMKNNELSKGVPGESIWSPGKPPWKYESLVNPFEKVSLRIGETMTDYWRLKSEPHRFYKWDQASQRLIRDHSIYQHPKLGRQ